MKQAVRNSVSSPCKGEDEGEGPCTARIFRARFKILPPASAREGYAKLSMKQAICRIGGFAIAISALVLIAAPADAQMRPMMIPLTTTMVIAKPDPGEIFGSKQVVTMGVGGKTYTFLLKDAYVDDPSNKVRWPDVWQLVRQYKPNFNVAGMGADAFEKMKPGETMTVRGMFSGDNQTFEVMGTTPGESHPGAER
jgi:hypothetical protein